MKQPKTLSELYIAAKTDTGYKDVFLKEAKRLYSGFIPNAATFDQTVHIFKNKGVLNENYVDLKPSNSYEGCEKEGWEVKFKNFLKEAEEESVKADTSKQSKYVDDVRKNSYDNSDVKNLDNQIGQEVLNGIYFEGKENPDKTLDELRAIVSKNLAKDPLYYVKNAMFGVKGVGVSDEIPGLKVSKTDQMTPVKMKSINESKENKLEQRLKDIDKAGGLATIEAKMAAIDEEITARTERINMIDENEDLAELVNPVKLREMKKEIKTLEKEKEKFQKLYEKMTGKKKQEVITEPEEVEDEELNESAEDDYIDYSFEKGDKVRFGGESNWKGQEVIYGIVLKANGPYLTIRGENGKTYHENSNDVEKIEPEELNEGEQYGKSPEEDSFLRKVKEENPEMLTKFINMVKNKGLEVAKEKYNEFDPEIISQNKTKASSEENDKKLLISFSKFLPKKLPELWEKTMKKTGEAEDGAFYLLLGALIRKYGDRYGDDKADRIDTLITGFGLNDEEYTDKIDEFWWNLIDEKYGKHVIEW